MASEKANPLPRGVYWVDVFEPAAARFAEWFTANTSHVNILTTEHFEANDGGPARDWVLFEVLTAGVVPNPVNLGPKPGGGIVTVGYPERATRSTTSADTVQRPPPEPDPWDSLTDGLGQVASFTKAAAVVGAAGLGLYLLSKASRL